MSLDSVAPTRMNLLTKRAQIKLAADGVVLLEGKREALLKELIERAKQLKKLRTELQERGRAAVVSLAVARALRGTPEVKSAGVAGKRELGIEVKYEKVWGIELGVIEQHNVVRAPQQRGFGLFDASGHVMEAAELSERMLSQLIDSAPVERNIQLLGEEVKKTSRRINALNEYLLPKLRREVRSIEAVLDEREREDIFRLKRIKGKKDREEKEKKRRAESA